MTPTGLASETWFLTGESEESVRAQVPINSTPFQVGRRSDLPLSLPCLTVSKLHAELVKEASTLRVRDLNSMNGTFVNGQRIHGERALSDGDLLQFGNVVFQVEQDSQRAESHTLATDSADRAQMFFEFDRLMTDRAVLAFFQPIVKMDRSRIVGYEVLGRSLLFGLETPQAMFQVATVLKVEAELSRILRLEGIQACDALPGTPALFFNMHPAELDQFGLMESLAEVRNFRPDLPITLEIHEAMVTSPNRMMELHAALRDLDIGLAYDDFGTGQSRLLELLAVPPDYVKFDLSMIQCIDRATAQKQKMLSTLVSLVRDAGIIPLAEGIEREEESEVCAQIGFELAQGFHFGRPALARDCTTGHRA